MGGVSRVDLTSDCAECGLEGGLVETYDALEAVCRFGVPIATACKLCGAAARGRFDREVAKAMSEIPANRCPGCLHELAPEALDTRSCARCGGRALLEAVSARRSFERLEELEGALDAWAAREGFASRQALVSATFVVPEVARLFALLAEGSRLEVIADPFATMGMKTVGASSSRQRAAAKADAPAPPPPPLPPPSAATSSTNAAVSASTPTAPPPSAPPRAIVYPLVSVIAADGEIHPAERALVDRFLQSEGLAPLSDEEFAVHHPSAVAHLVPRTRREEVIKLMCESAAIDGMPDESERRVIRAYASAWHVDDEQIEFWLWGYEAIGTSLTRQLWLKLRRFVLSARWGEPENKS